MSARCYKSVDIPVWPEVVLGRKTAHFVDRCLAGIIDHFFLYFHKEKHPRSLNVVSPTNTATKTKGVHA